MQGQGCDRIAARHRFILPGFRPLDKFFVVGGGKEESPVGIIGKVIQQLIRQFDSERQIGVAPFILQAVENCLWWRLMQAIFRPASIRF